MYQNIFYSKKDDTLFLWDDEKGMISFPYESVRYAYKLKNGGKYKSIYGDELEKVTNFNERDPSLFESDLKPEMRVLIDTYQDSDEPSTGHRIIFFDIEVDSEGGFPNITKGDKEITAISLYDNISKQYIAYILDKDGDIEDETTDDVSVISCTDEDQLLRRFLDKWEEIGPTIITGWNTSGFDIPYLYNRMKVVVGNKNARRLSPINIVYINRHDNEPVVAGVSCLDYIQLYKKFSNKNMPNYQLNTVGKIAVGMEKVQYEGNLNTLYKTDVKKYIEYNLQDVRIVVALEEKLKFIGLARRLCHIGHVPYEWFGMSSRYLDGAIILYIRRKDGLIAPNRPEREESSGNDDHDEKFSGAYVKEPIPGRYPWIFDLDITSEYPSVIRSLNISPETKIGKCYSIKLTESGSLKRRKELIKENLENTKSIKNQGDLEEWIKTKLAEFYMDSHLRNDIEWYNLGQSEYSHEEFLTLIKDNNYSLASNGVMYSQKEMGIVPDILQTWFSERVEMRKKAKKFLEEGNKDKYDFYNQRQHAQKILLNSVYGCLGLKHFRFYDLDNAEGTTKTGVSVIKASEKVANLYYNKILGTNEDYVRYLDTDSIFLEATPLIKNKYPEIDIDNEKEMTDAIMEIADEVQHYVNSFYDVLAAKAFNLTTNKFQLKRRGEIVDTSHVFEIKQEVIAKTAFWLAKKRYAQWIIHKEGVLLPEPELEVKGIDVVRTNFPIKFRSFMKSFLIDILNNVKREIIDEKILQFKKDIEGFNIIDIAKNTSVKYVSAKGDINYFPKVRQPFSIVTGTPAGVKSAIYFNDLLHKWGLIKKVEKIHNSSKIKWLYLRENEYGIDCLALKADGTDPKEILDFIEKYVDRTAMYERELKGKLKQFYSVLNWDFPSEEMKTAKEFFEF